MFLFVWLACSDHPSPKPPEIVEPPPVSSSAPEPEPVIKKQNPIGATTGTQQECSQRYENCFCRDKDNCFPSFSSSVDPLSDALRSKMMNVTWREGCPVGLDELASVNLFHWTPQQTIQQGTLIVAAKEAQNIKQIFQILFENQFPLVSIRPMFHFDGSDDASMKANNTSAFNCRNIKNTNRYSQHSYGEAIDVNPLWNPWVKGNIVDPPEGKDFLDRTLDLPGLIHDGDIVVQTFANKGWKWAGNWTSRKDYQHFSTSGK